jgi:hypothetical protein
VDTNRDGLNAASAEWYRRLDGAQHIQVGDRFDTYFDQGRK